MKTYYCWRFEQEMPFLEEDEWNRIEPLLIETVKEIKEYRAKHGCDIRTAKKNIKNDATNMFEQLTGMPNVDYESIYHLRLSSYGPECKDCGYLLRSPRASFCANCGEKRVS